MVERIAFKGKTAEQVAAMPRQEFLNLISSRERRWIERNSLQYKKITEKILKRAKSGTKKAIRTHTRETVILPEFIGLAFEVYDGKAFQPVNVTATMVGHRLGEFAYTTKRVQHSNPGIRATRGSKFLAVK
jgi:small subunit ribosomal protein S19